MLIQGNYNAPTAIRIFDQQGECGEQIPAPILDGARYSCMEDEEHVYFIVQRDDGENGIEIVPFDKHARTFGPSIVQQGISADENVSGVACCADGLIVAVQNAVLGSGRSNALRLYVMNEKEAPRLLLGEEQGVVHVLEVDRNEGQILLLREEKEHVYNLTRYRL